MGKKALRAVSDSLSPDNINFPVGMKFRQSTKDKRLRIVIEEETANFETLISTLDEIVAHVSAATSAIEKIELL